MALPKPPASASVMRCSPGNSARLTQALLTALSAPTAAGRLYEVDMRLRPSGRQGPVATSIESFRAYQMDEAWTWEHLALTRARVVAFAGAGGEGLAHEVEALRLREDLHAGLPSIRAVGYRQAWEHLDGTTDAARFRDRAIFATRQLAKRQLTWLRGQLDALWFDPQADAAGLAESVCRFIPT